ncbi:ABC transporter substrate-binding protein [Paenibacillus mendelii]|uniref:ABC transporter substrate-binding protein n=1 Tax=Paenibacillus mendelii TaxID=206163 RepID=A0ABV6JC68_9BACL|nr:ABC transporter substrate-binding protein [Paenibacillus mendelii]MCQ6561501.1 ABC transporter substrate-binding protein [Paenibacillus mendelii]
MRRTLSALIACIILIAVFTTACSNNSNNVKDNEPKPEQAAGNTPTEPAAAETSDAVAPAGEFPIVKEKITLKVMAPENAGVENYATNLFTKELEEKTNIHLEWIMVPEKNVVEKLNLMLVSGDYPDILLGMGVNKTQEVVYGGQGAFLPMNDLIEKYSVETKKLMETLPLFKETITAPDGNIYSLPKVNQCFHCTMSQKMWLYEPWLTKLGLSMPTTTEEFYTVLKAFKEKDPNGNSKADEIPFMTSVTGWNSALDDFLMNAFIYNSKDPNAPGLLMRDGKVTAAYDKPEWKEGLQYLRRLFQEGLIAPESFTQDKNQLLAVGNNPDAVLLGSSPGGFQGEFLQLGDVNDKRWLGYKAVPALKGPAGVQLSAYSPMEYYTGQFVIMKGNKYPEASFRLADMFYDWDITMRLSRGVEGKNWKKAESGDMGIDGNPAKWAPIPNTDEKIQNDYWNELGPINLSNEFRLSQKNNGPEDLEVLLYQATNDSYAPYKPDVSILVPPLVFNEEQSAEIAGLQKTIDDYRKEMLARFVTGDADLDKDWDRYVSTLKDMSLERYLSIYQEAYDKTKH